MIGFACNVHPDSIHVPSFQYTLNMKLQEHCSGQMRNTYENMSHRVGIELPAVLPPAQVYRQKILAVNSNNNNSSTYHTDKVDGIAIHVPVQFRAVFRNMISNIAQIDPKFELCDKTYYYGDKEMKNTYLKQVQLYNDYVQSHRTIRFHGFSIEDIDEVSNALLNIPTFVAIEPTNFSTRRGMYLLLVKNEITSDQIDQMDDICARLSQRENNFSGIRRYRQKEQIDQYTTNNRAYLLNRYKNAPTPAVNAWSNRAIPQKIITTSSDVSLGTTTTVPLANDASQQLIHELQENQQLQDQKLKEVERRMLNVENKHNISDTLVQALDTSVNEISTLTNSNCTELAQLRDSYTRDQQSVNAELKVVKGEVEERQKEI